MRDIASLIARDLHRLMNRSERGAPADDGQRPVILPNRHILKRNVARDPGDLVGTSLGHPCVIVGIIRDVARVVIALEAADAMLESWCPRFHPGPGERLGIAQERMKSFRIGAIADREFRQIGFLRNAPRLRGMREIAVAQHDDGCHVLRRQAHRFDGDVEAIRGRRRREHREWGIGVAAMHRLEQIRLLRLRRHAGRWTGALRIDDDERQLRCDGEAQHFGLQRDAGAGARRHAECAGI